MRETILFAVHDLLKDPPFSRIDFVSCRNLLIYLDREAQRRAFDIFHFALVEKGMLFLGSSESIEDAGSLFTTLDKKYRLYGRRIGNRCSPPEGSASLGFALETQRCVPIGGIVETSLVSATQRWPLSSATSPGSSRSWAELHLRLLERFAPPSVIVDGTTTSSISPNTPDDIFSLPAGLRH
jgi:two-component system CheB/CheR fusion protein